MGESPQCTPMPVPVAASPRIGGRYQLLEQLAIGGMAEVYLAQQSGVEGFEKLVVIKRILPQLQRRNSYVRMFLDEARLAAQLHHPNIVQVFDVGSTEGCYYMAMEFVHGRDVRNVLRAAARKRVRAPLGVSLSIVQGVCRGLHYAHEKTGSDGAPLGIVHRDVSPANVLVNFAGLPKILDFGVAKAASHREQTQSGTLKGKIGYMSPEQCRGHVLDRRSDVFAIGILLYEMTTGRRLFHGGTELDLLLRISREDAPSPAEVVEDYPPELERIVRRALARDRDQRTESAQELERELAAFVRSTGIDDSPLAVADFMKQLFPDNQVEPTCSDSEWSSTTEPSISIEGWDDEEDEEAPTPDAFSDVEVDLDMGDSVVDPIDDGDLCLAEESASRVRTRAGWGRLFEALATLAVVAACLSAAAAAWLFQEGRPSLPALPSLPTLPTSAGETDPAPVAAKAVTAAEEASDAPSDGADVAPREAADTAPVAAEADDEDGEAADDRARRRRARSGADTRPQRSSRRAASTAAPGESDARDRAVNSTAKSSAKSPSWDPDSALLPPL